MRKDANMGKKSTLGREWLDRDGAFLFGKHRGETVEKVSRDDSGYLRWVVETIEDIVEEDRDVIETMLQRRRRR